MKNKTLSIVSVVLSICCALLGVIGGVIGLCKYETKSTGWILSLVAVCVGGFNMALGLMLSLAGIL